jgi:hypothetical protein
MTGFNNSFQESFKTGFASGSAGALDAIKEKIKQSQAKADEKYKAETLKNSNIAMASQFGDEDIAKKIITISEAAGNSSEAQKNIGEFVSKILQQNQKMDSAKNINNKIFAALGGGQTQPQAMVTPTQIETSQVPTPTPSGAENTFNAQTGFKPVITGISDEGIIKVDRDTPKEQATRALQIRGSISQDPVIKDFQTIRTSVEQMDTLLEQSRKGNLKQKNALDQALITTFSKINDPSSVVRESEYARTPEGLPLVNKLPGLVQKVQSGGAGLTDEDREDLVTAAKIISDVKGKVYNTQRNQYKVLSKMFAVPEESVMVGFSEHTPFFNSPKASDVGDGVSTTPSGNTFRKK